MSAYSVTPVSATLKRWSGIGLLLIRFYLVIPIALTHWTNWWACFIALPAVFLACLGGMLAERSHRLTRGARAVLSAALFMAVLTLMFLLQLSWALFWPLMIIVPMLGLLSLAVPFSKNPLSALFQQWLVCMALAGLALGLEFQLSRLEILPLYTLTFRWWSLNIFLIFIGGLVITAGMFVARRHILLVLSNLSLALCFGFSAVISFYHLNWNLFGPLFLLSFGFLLVASSFFPLAHSNHSKEGR